MSAPFKQAAQGNFSPGRSDFIRYIVVHYTGNSGDTAQNNLDYFARTKAGTSAHYFVDAQGAGQSGLDTDTAWHCGRADGRYRHPACRNANSIGVEMCDSVGTVPAAVRDNTAALVRALMEQYAVPPERVLRHYDVTGKKCPAPWVDSPGEWDKFKVMLREEENMTQEQFDQMMDSYLARRGQRPASSWAVPYIQEAIDAGLISDVGGSIDRPQGFVTREELAAVAAALAVIAARGGGRPSDGP